MGHHCIHQHPHIHTYDMIWYDTRDIVKYSPQTTTRPGVLWRGFPLVPSPWSLSLSDVTRSRHIHLLRLLLAQHPMIFLLQHNKTPVIDWYYHGFIVFLWCVHSLYYIHVFNDLLLLHIHVFNIIHIFVIWFSVIHIQIISSHWKHQLSLMLLDVGLLLTQ